MYRAILLDAAIPLITGTLPASPIVGSIDIVDTPPPRATALADAIDTMMRGVAFLGGRAAIGAADGAYDDRHRAAIIGNSLRELDRFLLILLDEIAAASGMSRGMLRALRRRRTATAKLAAHPALFGHQVEDRAHLLALASQKARLLDRAKSDGGRSPVVIDIAGVSAYYGRLTARLVGHADRADARRMASRMRPPAPALVSIAAG